MDAFDWDLLKRPNQRGGDELCDAELDAEADDSGTSPAPLPWLDPDCPEPPMPMANTPYNSLLIDPSSLESDLESNSPMLATCPQCYTDLKAGRVPRRAMANYNYLGPVPEALQGLTVIEEAMIALCHATYLHPALPSPPPHTHSSFPYHLVCINSRKHEPEGRHGCHV
jgi:hypothetical protein